MLIGYTLKDRYRIYDRLGAGGAATVYLGRDSHSGQMVVIKVVHPHLVDEQFMGRFKREIDLLQQIDTPYIIRLYDWGLREHHPDLSQPLSYIVAEFIEGHTLADIIDTRGPLSEDNALAITRQIARGLALVHSLGIVHRDVKSQNIMITPDDQVKLIDFGIAKGQGHATLTMSSHFTGTLYYAAPEQILGSHSVDHRADIYSLGVVLYEMLTASLPIKAREMGTVASRIIAGKLDPVTGVSPPVEALVNDMLAADVNHRIESADAVIARIDAVTGGEQQPHLPARPALSTTTSMRPVGMEAVEEHASSSAYMLVTPDGRTFSLSQAETIVGRSHPRHPTAPDVDLLALEPEDARTVSRRHCRIFREGDDYLIEDLGSLNGTRLNDNLLEAGVPVHLQDGDRIAVGQVRMTLRRVEI